MVDADRDNTTKTLQNLDFDTDFWELIYETWLFLCDRNAKRTLEVLKKHLRQLPVGELPFTEDDLPSQRTLQRKIKAEAWDERANDQIRSTAKHIDESQISRMFVISDLALNFAHQLLEDGYSKNDHAGVLAVKWDAAKEMLKFRGLGTAGVVGAPTLEVKVVNQIDQVENMSVEERSESIRQGILKRKEERRLTGR